MSKEIDSNGYGNLIISLSSKPGKNTLLIGEGKNMVKVTMLAPFGIQVKLSIMAPKSLKVDRESLRNKKLKSGEL